MQNSNGDIKSPASIKPGASLATKRSYLIQPIAAGIDRVKRSTGQIKKGATGFHRVKIIGGPTSFTTETCAEKVLDEKTQLKKTCGKNLVRH